MKTRLIIEIESPDAKDTFVIPDADRTADSYNKKELADFRKEYSVNLHKWMINSITDVIKCDELGERLYDSDMSVEDWDELESYGIKIKVTTE